MRVLVSGVGRSATTMLYRQIGQMIRSAFSAPRYRYEPYLWRLNVAYPSDAGFGPADLSPIGMHAHRATPLHLDGRHKVHNAFIEEVFGKRPMMDGDPDSPDAWLVKVIRGSGRLESYLKALPDLKIVICTRNPIDTLNSSLGMFSFTGEEFHESDAPRLVQEARRHCRHIAVQDHETASHLAISALWWRACTEWSLDVAARYPDRCHIFRHEAFSINRNAEIDRLARFLGFSSSDAFKVGVGKSAGPKIATRHLLNADIAELDSHLVYYLEECLAPVMTADERNELRQRIWRQNAEGEFYPQIAADKLGRRSTLQLRREILAGRSSTASYTKPSPDDVTRIPLQHHLKTHCRSKRISLGTYKIYNPAPRREDFTFGCCITAFNNRETIRDAIFSALDQTMPFDRIVVVDDASTDGTQSVLAELEGRYSSVSFLYKKHNGGTSAARNMGLKKLGTRYLTHLDGDDCFWPTKNRAEAEVVFDDPEAVAFSLTLADRGQHGTYISQHSGYSTDSKVVFDNLLSRVDPIPRDLTFSNESFHAIGGYDPRLSLYEDWDFKLRLAQISPRWHLSGSDVGTVYNRRNSGLSSTSDREHLRSLVYVFAKAAIANPQLKDLAKRFEEAVATRRQLVSPKLYALMARIDAGDLDVSALKPFTSRAWIAMHHTELDSEAEACAQEAQRCDLEWRPLSGFAEQRVQLPSIDRPRSFWISEKQSVIALKVKRQIRQLHIELFNPVAATRVEVEARAGSAPVFNYSFELPLGQKRGRWVRPNLLSISHILQPGDYELVFHLLPLHEDVSRLWQVESNRMHLALSDVRAAAEGTLR